MGWTTVTPQSFLFTELEKLVIGDSIPKFIKTHGIGSIKNTTLSINRGINLKRTAKDIASGSIKVAGYDHILVHVGTNTVSDILRSNRMRANEIYWTGRPDRPLLGANDALNDFKETVSSIRQYNTTGSIIFSGIISRLCDLEESESLVVEVNRLIREYCCVTEKLLFTPTYAHFVKNGRPITDLYDPNDYLHVSRRGNDVLTHAFQIALSNTNITKNALCKRLRTQLTRNFASSRCLG